MPRFFLNLYDDKDTFDDEGCIFLDADAAKVSAIAGARSIIAESVMEGRAINLSFRIEISDTSGQVLAVIPFSDTVTFRLS
ncbi:DUF6894 family protein [Sphingomonas montanisoli]|uniref:DUF6894 family protein n=1 Tax=Sphingomonas montanisoli TaxID=2606412 RepID=UPI003CCC7A3B